MERQMAVVKEKKNNHFSDNHFISIKLFVIHDRSDEN